VLASYSVRDMGDYVQYAIITLSLQQDSNDEEDVKNNTAIYVKHTASIPYSAIPTTLKRLPRLSITNSLAFVTFDKNVVAVSLDRKSVFEESVVLRDKDDHVLFTEVTETVEDDKSIDIAVIYTLKSGILEFEIDAHKIQESRATG
jgi:type III secretory pathway lipoprotein EscJ